MIVNFNLLAELVKKDLKLRYSRPFLGFIWAFLSPLCVVAIFYLVFYLFLKVKIEEAPFILYLMSAIFTWKIFADSLMGSVTSLVDNRNLIKESRFPQYLIPVSVVLANTINALPSLALLLVCSAMILKGLPALVIFLPLVLLIQIIFTANLAVIFSLLFVRWRDIKYMVELSLMLLFYLIPNFYSLSLAKNSFSPALYMAYIYNPLVGILNLYRSVFLKGYLGFALNEAGISSLVLAPLIFLALGLALSIYLFRKLKDTINDYISY